MKDVTSFLRRKGYPLREIGQLLEKLQSTQGYTEVLGRGGTIRETLEELRNEPLMGDLAESRSSLKELGVEPQIEHGHTLRIVLPASEAGSSRHLCLTRLGETRWAYFVDPGTSC